MTSPPGFVPARPGLDRYTIRTRMMRKILLLSTLLLGAPLTAIAGDGMSYTYVEGGWNQLQISSSALNDPKADGGYVRGSFAIAEQVNVFGGWSRVSDTTRYRYSSVKTTLDQPHLGIGYHMPISDRLDFTADLAWNRRSGKDEVHSDGMTYTNKTSANTAVGNFGLRGKPSARTEAWVKAGYMDGNNHFDGTWTGTVGGQVSFNRTWGVVAEGQFYDDFAEYRVGVRASF